eukprot:1688226-Rhodomonas_salina.1
MLSTSATIDTGTNVLMLSTSASRLVLINPHSVPIAGGCDRWIRGYVFGEGSEAVHRDSGHAIAPYLARSADRIAQMGVHFWRRQRGGS